MKLKQEFKIASTWAAVTAGLAACVGAGEGAALKCVFNNLVPMSIDVLHNFSYAECAGAGALLMFGFKGITAGAGIFKQIYSELKPVEAPVRRKPAHWKKEDAVDVEFRVVDAEPSMRL